MQLDSREESSKAKKLDGYLIALFLVLSALAAFFYKSVFLGKPITKMGLLPDLDAMFNPGLKQAILNFRDPSGYLIYFPNGFFEEQCWRQFVPPLWNPYVACGYPLFGDPQSLMHSAAHLLGLFSGPEAYNTGLLLEIAVGGVGMVLLSRICGLSPFAAVLASLAYVLSPRVLVQMDIGGNECFFPWVFLAFAWLALSPSIARAAIVGVACSFVAFASHPETVFFAVAFAAVLAFFYMLLDGLKYGDRKARLRRLALNLVKATGLLAVTALVSLAVAAPMVFPFLQFMSNAHLYKAEQEGVVQASTWKDFFGGLYANQGFEPYFIGVVAVLLAPLGLIRKKHLSLAFLLTLSLALPLCMPSGLLLELMSRRPFSYVATYYGIAEVLMILALAAGLGLDRLRAEAGAWKTKLVLCLSFLAAFMYPIWHLHNEVLSWKIALIWKNGHNLLGYTSIIVLTALLFCCVLALRARILRVLALSALLSLNFASLAFAGRTVLPVNPPFSMQAPEPVMFLQSTGARCLATGYHFFLPNANLDFGVRDFRCFSPLLPVRFQAYLKSCGAQTYNLYFYALPEICSRLLDTASVKYVATRAAIRGEDEKGKGKISLPAPPVLRLLPGLRIRSAELYWDPLNCQIDASFIWRVHDLCRYRYSLQYFVFDADGREIWSGREEVLEPSLSSGHEWKEEHSVPVPPGARFPVTCRLRVTDTWTGSELQPPSKNADTSVRGFLIACVAKKGDAEANQHRHFKLDRVFANESCRIYENTQALPEAYLLERAHVFSPPEREAVLARLHSPDFDPRKEVLIESEKEPWKESDDAKEKSDSFKALVVRRINCNQIEIDCSAEKDSILVLTESYYPGWKCFIDGSQSRIYPANYLFRAVRVSPGNHKVRFVFAPESYYVSALVSTLTILAVLLLAFGCRNDLFTGSKTL